jgi:16S rRNA (uracil1498-N3)-methyltransferase
MRTHRFYTDIPLETGNKIQLPKEAAHHCAQVLRYKIGDRLTVFNGDSFDYLASITSIEKKRCEIEIEKRIELTNESPLKIHLIQGIAKGDKMDLIIQKAVELGVSEITPIFTERCNVKLDAKRLAKKLDHWNNIAISACEQSGRAVVPKVNSAVPIEQLAATESLSFYLEPTANKTFRDYKITDQTVELLIGPEGGFSEKDLRRAKEKSISGVALGPRILRTETAGLSAIAILQSQFGDL